MHGWSVLQVIPLGFLSSVCAFYVKGPNSFAPGPFLGRVQGFVKHAVLVQVIYNHVRAQMIYTYN